MDDVKALRIALAKRDLALLESSAGRRAAAHWPQLGGQLLLLCQRPEPALVEDVTAALRQRGWEGDELLVDQLLHRRQPLAHIDLELLASVLDGQDDGRLDLRTGEAWPALDDGLEGGQTEDDEDQGRVLDVPAQGGRAAWLDRATFAETLALDVQAVLQDALHGRKPFRSFASALDRYPEHIGAFHAWCAERAMGRARAWLADAGVLAEADVG